MPKAREHFVDIGLPENKALPDKTLIDPIDRDESAGNEKNAQEDLQPFSRIDTFDKIEVKKNALQDFPKKTFETQSGKLTGYHRHKTKEHVDRHRHIQIVIDGFVRP